MKIRLASQLTKDSIVDGPGLRAVLWTQGCKHHCFGCHNPETHPFDGGFDIEVDEIIKELQGLKLQRGITLSGGDPLEQPEACLEIAKAAKAQGLDVWMYTGYIFEDIVESFKSKPAWQGLLEYVDVIVDGPFIQSQKSLILPFRGSKNQRVIDVRASLDSKRVITIQQYEQRVV